MANNGYMAYALSMQAELEHKLGKKLGKPELVSQIGPYWQKLSAEEKRQWKIKAKSAGKKNPTKEESECAEKQLLEDAVYYSREVDFKRKRTSDICKSLVYIVSNYESAKKTDPSLRRLEWIEKQYFSVLHIVPHYQLGTIIAPAEIALVVFSLGGGIVSEQSWLIQLEDETEGFSDSLYENSYQQYLRHGIELEGLDDMKKCFYVWNLTDMVDEFNQLLMQDSEQEVALIAVFGDQNIYNCVQGSLQWIKDKIGQRGLPERKQVVCVDSLVGQLRNQAAYEAGSPPLETEIACNMISERFNLDLITENLSQTRSCFCQFHKLHSPQDDLYCALGVAKMTVRHIFCELDDFYDFPLEDESHNPGGLEVEHSGPSINLCRFQNGANDGSRHWDVVSDDQPEVEPDWPALSAAIDDQPEVEPDWPALSAAIDMPANVQILEEGDFTEPTADENKENENQAGLTKEDLNDFLKQIQACKYERDNIGNFHDMGKMEAEKPIANQQISAEEFFNQSTPMLEPLPQNQLTNINESSAEPISTEAFFNLERETLDASLTGVAGQKHELSDGNVVSEQPIKLEQDSEFENVSTWQLEPPTTSAQEDEKLEKRYIGLGRGKMIKSERYPRPGY